MRASSLKSGGSLSQRSSGQFLWGAIILLWSAMDVTPRRCEISSSGTHCWTVPRAIVKKFLRSGLVKRPLPSARFEAKDSAALIELIDENIVAARMT